MKRLKGFNTVVEGKTFAFPYRLKTGVEYVFECAVCDKESTRTFTKEQAEKHICPHCGAAHLVMVTNPKPAPAKKQEKAEEAKAENEEKVVKEVEEVKANSTQLEEPPKLLQRKKVGDVLSHGGMLGGRLRGKAEPLYEGANTVGRNDEEEPSDINLDDGYVSRRSITITARKAPGNSSYTFRLVVNKASNGIYVNGKRLNTGNLAYLQFGDKIKLGKTTLTLKKS